jgi:hypothetical protein
MSVTMAKDHRVLSALNRHSVHSIPITEVEKLTTFTGYTGGIRIG